MENKFNIPSKKESENNLKNYKSDINLSEYKDKLFEDPEYSQAEVKSLINYSSFSGEGWELESYKENNSWNLEISNKYLKKSTDKFTISFPNYDEMISFISNIYP